MEGVDAATAYRKGLPITRALKHDRRATKLLLFAELKRLWRSVRVGEDRTWKTDEDLQDCVDDIIDLHRTLKMEEVMLVFRDIRRGMITTYGRLDTPTILKALSDHDVNVTTGMRETDHQGKRDMIPMHLDQLKKIAETLPIGELTLQEKFARPSQIPEHERQAMRDRDRQRISRSTQGET